MTLGRAGAGLIAVGVALAIGMLVVWQLNSDGGDPVAPPPDLADTGEPAALPDAKGLALRPGEDRELVQESCTSCHSLAPIIRHDGFAEDVWAAEVKKMIDDYGAPIDDERARRITAYLQRHYSDPPDPARGTASAPGVE